jgi:SAM-dependent methyltransferase
VSHLVDRGSLVNGLARHDGPIGVDLGCGDARATARWAAAEPDTLVVGIDANLDSAARVARRARRPRDKGGLPNLVLVRASVQALPAELEHAVDALRIELPWGDLLEGLLPEPGARSEVLATVARLLAPGGTVRIALNARALPHGLARDEAEGRLRRGLQTVGLAEPDVGTTAIAPTSGWGKRLAAGRALEVILAEARQP